MGKGIWLVLAGLLVSGSVMAQKADTTTSIPVVIDTDIGDDIDDAYAVVHALRSPHLNVLGITTCYGDTFKRRDLLVRLLDNMGLVNELPVGVGPRTESKTSFTQFSYASQVTSHIMTLDAEALLLDQAKKYPGKVTLIAIGPLVNIGSVIDIDPEGFRNFKQVVIMSGSIRRGYDHGDRTKHAPPSPEWNARNDVKSLRKLLASGVPVYMLPLDSTQVKFPQEMRDRIFARIHPVAKALKTLTELHGTKKPKILYDSVTVAFVEDPRKFPLTPMHITVTDDGYTKEGDGEPNAFVCLESDEAEFLKVFEQRLTFD